MVTILPALRQVKEDLVSLLDRAAIERMCTELGHRWRDRQFDPYTTVHMFILQVLHQNTSMTHLPHLSGERFSPSAYCQARQRLPLPLLEQLVGRFNQQLGRLEGVERWHGHRVWLADGSGFSMPDTPALQAEFGQPGNQRPGCGFPVAHALALFDAQAGFIRAVLVHPLRTQDIAHIGELHPKMRSGDILVGDRGFCSYVHLALCSQAKLHAVFRVHQKKILNFRSRRPCAKKGASRGRPRSRWIKRLGRTDQLVEWQKPAACPKWMNKEAFDQLPKTLLVRELKWRIRESNYRVCEVSLVTTLLDSEKYPVAEVAGLYRQRWQIEVDLRDLKITLGLDVVKGRKAETVLKEVMVFVLVYNLVRAVILKAARRQRIKPHRLSFIDALRWLQPPKPMIILPDLVINPDRPGRLEPRCIKRHMKEYDLMTKPRDELRKRLEMLRLAG
jgi:hypothetical protein